MILKFVKVMTRNFCLRKFYYLLIFALLIVLFLLIRDFENLEWNQNQNPEFVPPRKLNISVITVVADSLAAENDYSTALSSVRCYCKMQGYHFQMIQDSDYKDYCNQSDFMFRRHCIVAKVLQNTDYVVFLDADMAVVNPNRRFEEFINPNFDITFYDRFVNWEVAAGSYIVKNTTWAVNFLQRFANFEKKIPKSFHGTDNGALHAFWQHEFYPQLTEPAQICYKIWEKSAGFEDLFTFEACIRSVMGDKHEFDKVRILKKGTGWVRDIWLSDSQWSLDRDFMLHGLKEINKIDKESDNPKIGPFTWKSPFLSPIRLEVCHIPESMSWNWDYDKKLIVDKKVIDKDLRMEYAKVERRKWKSRGRIAEFY